MSSHNTQQSPIHTHGVGCGHTAVQHDGHEDYLHDGRLEHLSGQKVETHSLDVNAANPTNCTPSHFCRGHETDHVHGPGCGHETVPHGDHHDYVVGGHLHHPCDKHCDDHGTVNISAPGT